ncbi:hypothetical protein ACQEU8_11500 [Streptomyces sp. CA-250714]|uniref:hypothetical protein n=1 Tax=Streptomyces sp. CA-250714 TaxID=3240060 RepID=UPI003D8C0928
MSEPIVYADQWRAVMQRAGYRCQCVGQCGSKHAKGDGRCERQHDKYADKHHGPARLIAAPDTPGLSVKQAAGLPCERLRAWCGFCLDGTRRVARTAALKGPDPNQGGLFDL